MRIRIRLSYNYIQEVCEHFEKHMKWTFNNVYPSLGFMAVSSTNQRIFSKQRKDEKQYTVIKPTKFIYSATQKSEFHLKAPKIHR